MRGPHPIAPSAGPWRCVWCPTDATLRIPEQLTLADSIARPGGMWLLMQAPDWPVVAAGAPIPEIPFERLETPPWQEPDPERDAAIWPIPPQPEA